MPGFSWVKYTEGSSMDCSLTAITENCYGKTIGDNKWLAIIWRLLFKNLHYAPLTSQMDHQLKITKWPLNFYQWSLNFPSNLTTVEVFSSPEMLQRDKSTSLVNVNEFGTQCKINMKYLHDYEWTLLLSDWMTPSDVTLKNLFEFRLLE